MASWGKVIGTGAVAVGALTAGVGLLGPELAAAVGTDTAVGSAAEGAAEAVNATTGAAADVVSTEISDKTATAVAGGTLAAAGVTTLLATSGRSDDDAEKAEEELKAIRRRMKMAEEAHGIDLDGDGQISNASLPNGKGPEGGRGA